MGLEDKAKAKAKDIEGKVQEAAGDLTGNQEAQVKGKAKQAEAKARQKAEEVKNDVKETID
ncbi:MAG: CsbD family protein [Cyanobacteria bacterium P01_C01_bin.120]